VWVRIPPPVPIQHCRLSIANFRSMGFAHIPYLRELIGNRQSEIGNAFARVMQSGRHRELKPSVLEVRILSRVPIQISLRV
jgi:hypothetical protein